jgi:hypothetical protein
MLGLNQRSSTCLILGYIYEIKKNQLIWGGVISNYIRHIQNIPDWYRSLYTRCGSAKHRTQQDKLCIPGSTAKFCGDCVETCEDVAPNFGEKRPGCSIITTPRFTLPSSPSSFWRNKKWLSSPTHRTPLIWQPVTSSYFQKWRRR